MNRIYVFFAALFLMTACVSKVDNRGHVDLTEKLAGISAGSHKQDVMRALGSPSTMSSFGDETWYYVQARKEAFIFMRPSIEDQQVLRITFNPSGMVKKVENFSDEDIRDVAMVSDVTPTEGHSLGFFEQVLGNLGKFNKAPGEAR